MKIRKVVSRFRFDASKRDVRKAWLSCGIALVCGAMSSQDAAAADVLCYKASSFRKTGHEAVRIYKKKCPKGYSSVSHSALSATTQILATEFAGEAGEKGPKGDSGPPGPQGDAGERGPRGPKGPTGLEGPPGVEGPPGIPGSNGDRGGAGPVGAKGGKGAAGSTGIQGESPQGDRGPQGIVGTGTDKLFRLSGSSGAVPIAPNSSTAFGTLLQLGAVQKSTFTELEQALASAPLLGTTCSKVGYFAEISSAPGASNDWTFRLIIGDPTGVAAGSEYLLCVIAGTATKCSGTVDVVVSALMAGSVAIQGSSNSMQSVRAHWNIRCLAS